MCSNSGVEEDDLVDAPGQLRLRFFSADDEGGTTFPFPLSATPGVAHGDGSV